MRGPGHSIRSRLLPSPGDGGPSTFRGRCRCQHSALTAASEHPEYTSQHRYRLSYAEVAELPAERGVAVDPSTVYDWVQAFTPRFLAAARAHRTRAGTRWRVDETLLTVGGRWRYIFRAIDEHGQVVDVYLSDHRDAPGPVRPS